MGTAAVQLDAFNAGCGRCAHGRAAHPGDGACIADTPNAGVCECGGYTVAGAPAPAPWWKKRLACFDTETTGADPLAARVVQAAFCLVGGGQATEKHTWLVDPGVEIPAEASAIHGITTERVRAEGIPTDKFLVELDELLERAWADGLPVCVMNAPYDFTVRAAEWARLGVVDVPVGLVLDPRVLDKQADEIEGFHRRGGRKLSDLCFHYQAQLDGAHDACHDAIAAARVVYRIAQRYRLFGDNSLENLQALQAAWYRDQQKSLDEYFKNRGKPGVDSFEWPVRRVEAP